MQTATTKAPVAALYVRFSRDEDNVSESNSIKNQKEMLIDYATKHGYYEYKIYADDGYSGTNFERPDFQKMITDIENGITSVIIIKDMSRLGRNYLQVGMYTEVYFLEKNVRFISVNDGIDSVNGIDDFVPFKNIMNEWYAKDISNKVRSVFLQKGKSGHRLIPKPIYGYKKDENSDWIIDEEAAKIIRLIYELYLDGQGVSYIAKHLANNKISAPCIHMGRSVKGRSILREMPYYWTTSTVGNILSQQEYCGDTVNFKMHRQSYKSKKIIKNNKEDYMIFKDTHEAIISRDDFEKVQEMRAQNKKVPSTSLSNQSKPFAGLIYCYDCKSRMYSFTRPPKNNIYICSKYRHAVHSCKSHYIREDILLEVIVNAINKVIELHNSDSKHFQKHLKSVISDKKVQQKNSLENRIGDYQKRIDELDNILKSLYEDKLSKKIDDDVFMRLSSQYAQEQKILISDISELKNEFQVLKNNEANISRFLAVVKKYEIITELNSTVLNDFIERIEVHEKKTRYARNAVPVIDIYFVGVGLLNLGE